MSGSRPSTSPSPINLSAPSGAEISRWFATGLVPQQARAAYWAELRPTVRGANRVLGWKHANLYNAEVISALEAAATQLPNLDPERPEKWFIEHLHAAESLEAFGLSPCGTQEIWDCFKGDVRYECATHRGLRGSLIPLARKARATAAHGGWVVEFLNLFERS